jgi:nitrite reductase (NADH) large subunit
VTRLVIVGNGMATGRLLDELLPRAAGAFDITVVGDEPHGSYNRIMLSPLLAGEVERTVLIQKPPSWYRQRSVCFLGGVRAEAIERGARRLRLSDGQELAYDQLVLATGARPARIAAANQHLRHLYQFRTLDDVEAIAARAGSARDAVVVGGGLLGLEAAHGLSCRGLRVTVVHRGGWLLNRQLDAAAGACLRRVLEARGIRFVLDAEVASFEPLPGTDRLHQVVLDNGVRLAGDLAVIATGIEPNGELGLAAGLAGQRAIQVDAVLATADPVISAVGECCEYAGATFGLVEPIWRQCSTLAARLSGRPVDGFRLGAVATKLKVAGVQVFSAGEFRADSTHRELRLSDPENNLQRTLLVRDGCIVGIALVGDVRDGQYYFDLMQRCVDVRPLLEALLLPGGVI